MSSKLFRALVCAFIVTIAVFTAIPLVFFITNYAALPETIVTYFTPWATSVQSHAKNLFYALRLPLMGLFMQATLLALYPDRNAAYPRAMYADAALTLAGASTVILSQFSLCPWLHGAGLAQPYLGILTATLMACGAGLAVWRYIRLTRQTSPDAGKGETKLTCVVKFFSDGCVKKRALLIGALALFMLMLIIPAFRAY